MRCDGPDGGPSGVEGRNRPVSRQDESPKIAALVVEWIMKRVGPEIAPIPVQREGAGRCLSPATSNIRLTTSSPARVVATFAVATATAQAPRSSAVRFSPRAHAPSTADAAASVSNLAP